jgi:hypothetical protein
MLAQRVTQAAGEVKALIEESVQATERGNALAHSAGGTMGRLVDSVTRVDTTFHSLSADTHEHAAGLVSMRDTMFEMKASTEQNLALAEQAQRIGDSLAERARELDQALSGFQLAGDGGAPPPSVDAAPTGTGTAPTGTTRCTGPSIGKPAGEFTGACTGTGAASCRRAVGCGILLTPRAETTCPCPSASATCNAARCWPPDWPQLPVHVPR